MYSPVVKFALVKILLSLVAKMNLELHQLDVEIEFLNGELKDINILTEANFTSPLFTGPVCVVI